MFTRGEHRDQLLAAVPDPRSETHFFAQRETIAAEMETHE
jgi:hypothetical protein